ncbi:hypothetical protein NDU88_004530 [Pleurodeles waltl]|uniref:Uncharacterized protein n=1 Tax=Pleurodeles waltl TaxID=8319 RepID=A0AAV7WW63_PLEWA|nr:hypothetical protein NDU88_004530 [Pleurodeles waltl]
MSAASPGTCAGWVPGPEGLCGGSVQAVPAALPIWSGWAVGRPAGYAAHGGVLPGLGTGSGILRGHRVAREGKIETMAVEVNLLRVDLRKVSDKVKAGEGSIVELQTKVGVLRKQVVQANAAVGRLEVRLEDAEGRSRRNNVRLLGFLERAEGSAAETFEENWIRDVLQPTGLSRVFVVQRAY